MPKKKPPAGKASPMRWTFDLDIPTHDFFESGSLEENEGGHSGSS